MRQTFRNYLENESGASALEWGLIAAGIAVMVIAVIQAIGANWHAGAGPG